ncbi:hypothetical protein DFQ26_005330 [Actinomortierella ambigua]|nr:hypothetical protein DFQ26_005330 [Actinomortierella ambigua]
MMNSTPGEEWKIEIDDSKPGADFFLNTTTAGIDALSYFRHRGATSSLRRRLMQELSYWIEFFAASDKQVLHDIANSLNSCRKQTLAEFWNDLAQQEARQKQSESLLEQRKIDIRRQNVAQLRIDGDVMTRELEEGLNAQPQKNVRPKRSSVEVATDEAGASSQQPPTKKVAFRDAEFSSASESDFVDSNSSARTSLVSIEYKYVDHLVGPGTTSSRFKTSDRLFVEGTNVSETLMGARRKILQKQSEIVDASDLLPGLWNQASSYPAPSRLLVQNEDTYTQSVVKSIVFGIVGDLDVIDHWSRDPLPTPQGFEELYFPDYFAEFDSLPLFVVEVKKDRARDDDLEGDQRKLPCMMKLILDSLRKAGVSKPSVIGLLIRKSRCEISSMSLDNEALYIQKLVGVFELPINNLQLGLLCPALGPLKFARDVVVQTTKSIQTRHSDSRRKDRWRRPSYYVKGNLIPTASGVEDESQ